MYASVLEMSSSLSESNLEQSIRQSNIRFSELDKTQFRLDAKFNIENKFGGDINPVNNGKWSFWMVE